MLSDVLWSAFRVGILKKLQSLADKMMQFFPRISANLDLFHLRFSNSGNSGQMIIGRFQVFAQSVEAIFDFPAMSVKRKL